MKNSFIFILIFFLPLCLWAQEAPVNLIREVNSSAPDSVKRDRFAELFEYYQFSNPDSASYYTNLGIKVFTEHKYDIGIAYLTSLLGDLDAAQGRIALARKRHADALELFKVNNYKRGIAMAHNGLGITEGRKGNYDSATMHFMIALQTYEEIHDQKGIMLTYLKLGVVNDISNQLDKSLEYYSKSLELANKQPISNTLVNLYNNIGVIHAKKGDLKSALNYFKIAYEKSDKPQFAEANITSLTNLGLAYDGLGDQKLALMYFNKALTITKDRHLPDQYTRVVLGIATIESRTNPDAAMLHLVDALDTVKKIGQRVLESEIYGQMIEIYKKEGNYKEAFNLSEIRNEIDDSLYSLSKTKEMANLESAYQIQQYNEQLKELELQHKSNVMQRNVVITIAVGLLIVILVLAYSYKRTIRLNKQLSKREEELKQSNNVKDRLFSIIGHDLRGPVGNIPVLLQLINDPNTTEEDKSYLMNTLIGHSKVSLETLDKLLMWGKSQIKGSGFNPVTFNATPYLQNNLQLIKSIADQKNITVTNTVSGDLSVNGDPTHFDFIVRNLISNAVKFTYKGGAVVINAERNSLQGTVVFSVKDNGVGIDKEKQSALFQPFGISTMGTANEKGTSMGLMLCKEFIVENGGRIWVESEQGKGSTFFFSLKSA